MKVQALSQPIDIAKEKDGSIPQIILADQAPMGAKGGRAKGGRAKGTLGHSYSTRSNLLRRIMCACVMHTLCQTHLTHARMATHTGARVANCVRPRACQPPRI